ncbi:MAG: hypothetical protein AB7X49_00390 [Geminicoccaceae bacterium]
MAGFGLPDAQIARILGLDLGALREDYAVELDNGRAKANLRVAENLYRKATGDGREAVTAAIFWMKARAGWGETAVSQTQPISHEDALALLE